MTTMFDAAFTAATQKQAAREGHTACVARLAKAVQSAVEASNRAGSAHASVPAPRSQFSFKVTDEVVAELKRRDFRIEERGFNEDACLDLWW